MKRNLIAACVSLTVLLALSGCSNTGSYDGTVNPSTSPSAGLSEDANNSKIPNNADGNANNGAGTGSVGTGTLGGAAGSAGTGVGSTGTGTSTGSHNGNYSANNNGKVDGDGAVTSRGLISDAGRAVRDTAEGAERAVRDIM